MEYYDQLKDLVKIDFAIGIAPSVNDSAGLHAFLTKVINELLDKDFEKLLSVMYRLDISEQKFRSALVMSVPAEEIARLVLEREYEKIKFRMMYKS